jgi:hypothetical protein
MAEAWDMCIYTNGVLSKRIFRESTGIIRAIQGPEKGNGNYVFRPGFQYDRLQTKCNHK